MSGQEEEGLQHANKVLGVGMKVTRVVFSTGRTRDADTRDRAGRDMEQSTWWKNSSDLLFSPYTYSVSKTKYANRVSPSRIQ